MSMVENATSKPFCSLKALFWQKMRRFSLSFASKQHAQLRNARLKHRYEHKRMPLLREKLPSRPQKCLLAAIPATMLSQRCNCRASRSRTGPLTPPARIFQHSSALEC